MADQGRLRSSSTDTTLIVFAGCRGIVIAYLQLLNARKYSTAKETPYILKSMHYTKKIMVSISIIISIYAGIYTFAMPLTQVEAVTIKVEIPEEDRQKPTEIKFITSVFGTDTFTLDQLVIGEILNRIFRFVFAITGTLAVLMLAVYGTQLIYGQLIGDVGKIQYLKGKVISVLVSLIILLLSYLILNTVNPDLVNFNLGFYEQGEVGINLENFVSKSYDSKEEVEAAGKEFCGKYNLESNVIGNGSTLNSYRSCLVLHPALKAGAIFNSGLNRVTELIAEKGILPEEVKDCQRPEFRFTCEN